MKRFLTIILATLTMMGAMAQSNKNRSWRQYQAPMSARESAAYLAKELGLTSAQQRKVEQLNTRYADLLRGPQGIGTPPPPHRNGNQPPHMNNGQRESWRTKGQGNNMPPRKPQMNEQMKKERDKQWKQYKKGMKKILTNKQYKAYEKMMANRPHR